MLGQKVAAINPKHQPLSGIPSLDYNEFDKKWFPQKIADLDNAKNVLMYGAEPVANHPVLTDPVYRKRREEFAEIANNYKYGSPIPKIQYTPEEIKTWGIIFRELHQLHQTHACKEHLENWQNLVKYCEYREDNIPQLQDVSDFLKKTTGFQLRPVAGYVEPRDFLAGLAFRVLNATQYTRHSSTPNFTTEPDICHELLGHVPMLLNPDFAQFSQDIGLASLGASDKDLKKLKKLYFYTLEFGMCKQDGELRVYGAALLSSITELKLAVSMAKKTLPWDLETILQQEIIEIDFQNVYFYTDNLEETKEKIRQFVKQIKRPFHLRYDADSQSIEVITDIQKNISFGEMYA